MERQVDEKFIKKKDSLALEVLIKSARVSCLHSRRSAPQRALTSAYPVSPHRLPGKKAVLFQTQLEAKREKKYLRRGGLLLLSTRLNKQKQHLYTYMNGKKEKRKNF